MADEKKTVIKVTKSYSRKLDLKAISSQFNNIECGTYISAPVEWGSQEELDRKLAILREKVFKETELSIAMAMQNLKVMSEDPKNSALVGNGGRVEITKFISTQVPGLEDLILNEDPTRVVLPPEFGEVDLDKLS